MLCTAIFTSTCFFPMRVVNRTHFHCLSFSDFSRLLKLSRVSSTFSRLLLWNPLPRFIWSVNEFTVSPSFKVLLRSFENSAALKASRYRCRSRHDLQIIRSLTRESSRSAKFKSSINFSSDSPGFWKRERNLYLTTVSFFFGLQRLSNALLWRQKLVMSLPFMMSFAAQVA